VTATTLPGGSLPAPSRGRPEAWLWGIAGLGWVALAVLPFAGGHHHGTGSLAPHAAGYLAMVAVMAPLIAPNVRYAAVRSPSRARRAVAADVVAAWALVWIGAVVLLGLGAWLLAEQVGHLAAIGLVTVGAAAWQWTPLKRRSLARCDRRLAPPLERRRARWASRRFGAVLGRDCVVSCGPLMALMAAAGHSVAVAAACVAVAWYERRRRPHHDPATLETSLGIAAIGATALVAAVWL
jgi:predicted metal-binding membrane protein